MDPGTVLLELDGIAPSPLAFTSPRAVVEALEPDGVRRALSEVEAATLAGRWAAGFIAYEAGPALDPALAARAPGAAPLVWFGLYDEPCASLPAPGEAQLGELKPDVTQEEHAAAIGRIRDAIARGDVYQVNHTFRLCAPFAGDPLGLYRRLRAAQGNCLGALVHLGSRAVVSASPELFLERRGDLVRARPMKGTARRGRFEEEDAAVSSSLAGSPKERAENVMITDLLRNDLGRVARPGSVKVTRLFEVERYRTVLQLTSTIEAQVGRGVGLVDLLAATFPSGSVTGAPRCMATHIIAREERTPRGPYCGAIGFVAPGGDLAFNVAIRTVELDLARGEATVGVGGAVTWGSSAAGEWDEALAKGAFLREPETAFDLLETLRLEGGRYPLLARHLARISGSASYFGRPLDPARVEAALAREASAWRAGERRVRLRVCADGAVHVESAPLPPQPATPLPVALASARVSRRDPFLFHKTSRRDPYDRARKERPDAFDVLLANEEGEVTEFTIGNVVVEMEGGRFTPSRDSGLLAGVFRAELLDSGEVRERTLRIADLGRATRLWLVNAVRGWVPVRLAS